MQIKVWCMRVSVVFVGMGFVWVCVCVDVRGYGGVWVCRYGCGIGFHNGVWLVSGKACV